MDSNSSKKQQPNYTRPNNSKACPSTDRKSTELQSSKAWPRNTRRREQNSALRNDTARNSKQFPSAKTRPNVDKRPRPRGGGGNNNGTNGAYIGSSCVTDDIFAARTGLAPDQTYGTSKAMAKIHPDYELNSVYAPGSKKQNLNHLLNFHCAPRGSDYSDGLNVFGRNRGALSGSGKLHRHNQSGGNWRKPKYNKEQFMQANFQFVTRKSATPKLDASPDNLVDWNLIEQIIIQTTEEPQCPICLYPPIAAKLTRCGHAYCWPCILHYLALSDKTWRKCPICYDAIHIDDLKSTTIVQQRPINVGDEIAFNLMRRKKGSMFIDKFTSNATSLEHFPQVSKNDQLKLFSKFLIAKRYDILDIIERERRELMAGEDETCPEFEYINLALSLLHKRREKLGEIDEVKENKIDDADDEIAQEITKDCNKCERENLLDGQFQKDNNGLIKSTEGAAVAVDVGPADVVDDDIRITSATKDEISHGTGTSTSKYHYFYQSEDGQNIYLHPLNVKMLQACYDTLDLAPPVIRARVLQQEHYTMDEEHRRKFACLSHLPLTCQFAVVEVDLQPPIITRGILNDFMNKIQLRQKERQRREREERKREKQINEINDRQMGKLIASTANINLNSSHEFPTCGFEESLFNIEFPNNSVEGGSSTSAAMVTSNRNKQASYSAVAVEGGESTKINYWPTISSAIHSNNSYQELSTWGKPTTLASVGRRTTSDRTNSESESILATPLCTTLSDVLAEAISQKIQTHNGVSAGGANVNSDVVGGGTVGGNKKNNKKSKKMLPLFSTGINYNGN